MKNLSISIKEKLERLNQTGKNLLQRLLRREPDHVKMYRLLIKYAQKTQTVSAAVEGEHWRPQRLARVIGRDIQNKFWLSGIR